MVRLRRELEGVRRNHAAAAPPWARDAFWSEAALPAWRQAIVAATPTAGSWPLRVCVAGALPGETIAALLTRGHLVTWVEPDTARRDALLAGLGADASGRLTVVAKDYGDAALAASSLDVVVLQDELGCYFEPRWVLHKVARELKPGGVALLRLACRGGIVAASDAGAPPELHAASGVATDPVRPLVRGLVRASWLHQPLVEQTLWRYAAREARQRGAHRADGVVLPQTSDVIAATADVLTVRELWLGSPDRLALADLQWAARSGVTRVAAGLVSRLPALGSTEATEPRLIAVRAERQLAGWRESRLP